VDINGNLTFPDNSPLSLAPSMRDTIPRYRFVFDNKRLYVTNVGVFRTHLTPAVRPETATSIIRSAIRAQDIPTRRKDRTITITRLTLGICLRH
jgi:hypothetical protein